MGRDKLKLPICLIGDMNSRTGTLEDTLDFEREVINDSETNDFAGDLFDMNFFDENSMINKKRVNSDNIVNGRTGSDRDIGDVTFQGHNGNSTIDYCITSPDIIPHNHDFQVDLPDKNLS